MTEKDLECEIQELVIGIEQKAKEIGKLNTILEQKEQQLKEMTNQTPCNHRTPPKYNVEYLDDKMVIVNGVQYQRVEPPKPQTLLEIILEWWVQDWTGDSEEICEQLVDTIERWMSQYKCDYVGCTEYLQGYNALMKTLKANLK